MQRSASECENKGTQRAVPSLVLHVVRELLRYRDVEGDVPYARNPPLMSQSGKLFYGDNLDVLGRHVKDQSVDLVYLDPPFNSNANYNILFGHVDGSRAAAQIKAFGDTWRWDEAAAADFDIAIQHGGAVADALRSFQTLLGDSNMLAYLSMMAPRLLELRRVLKSTGSLYLHCDPTASHYLKLLLDSIFGPENFRNEIIWRRTGSHNSSRRFGPIHDVLLFYSKSKSYYFKTIYQPYMAGHVANFFKKEDPQHGRYWSNALTGAGTRNGQSGRPWHGYDPTAAGRHWAVPGRIASELNLDPDLSVQEKLDALDDAGFIVHSTEKSSAMPTYRQYLDKSPGMSIQDVWAYQPHTSGTLYGSDKSIDEDVRWLVRQGDRERLGYPTQKPEGLLERIVESSCPKGGQVLDPFCGCGTAVAVAERLDRRWTGIDITILATNLIKSRLLAAFGEEVDFSVIGEPTTLEDAEQLAKEDKHQFEAWALGLVGARTATKKKGKDRGIDGRLLFQEKLGGKVRQALISVKGGGMGPRDVRDLRGVITRESAELGVLISMRKPTAAMRSEAATAGIYRSGGEGVGTWGKHPKIQLLTVEDLLNGKRIDMPPLTGSLSLPQAPREERRRHISEPLFRNLPDASQFSGKPSKPSRSAT